MKNLKLLNKFNLFFLIIFFFFLKNLAFSNEPIDIWNIKKKSPEENNLEIIIEKDEKKKSVYNLQTENSDFEILKDDELQTDKINIIGIYDPEENGLAIDMWLNSEGEEIKSIFQRLNIKKLSKDSKKFLQVALLTNSYAPNKNISLQEFLEYKSNYLINNGDLELIKKYLNKNSKAPNNSEVIRYFLDEYLSNSDLENACNIFEIINLVDDDYLTKFQIYCFIHKEKREEAQLLYDLKSELGFKDSFFEKKFNILMEYVSEDLNDNEISEDSILNFHLSHRTNTEFTFIPNMNTPKIIWRYLSKANLLENIELIDLEDVEKIGIVEKATHEKNYSEEELFQLYKRFQFNINQLITAKDTYKLLPSFEGRALLYQRLLLTIDISETLDLSSKLKKSFEDDGLEKAFEIELSKILEKIKFEDIPSNYTSFYKENLIAKKNNKTNIKFNNKFVHKSKLLNFFLEKTDIKQTEKDTNEILKKIKKDKKYLFSTKDMMLLESLKSDGIKISDKYKTLYKPDNPNIPPDIQLLINSNETGMILLRLAEIVGEDKLEDLGSETLYFIVGTLNLLNIDTLRNEILLQVLPLKV